MRWTVERSRDGDRWQTVAYLGLLGPATYPEAVLAALTSAKSGTVARVVDGTGRVVREFHEKDRPRLLEPVRAAVARTQRHLPAPPSYRDRVRKAVADFTERTRKTSGRGRRRDDRQLGLLGPDR